jgi:hypothetical protein
MYIHDGLSEQFLHVALETALESQAAIGKPEQAPFLIELLEGCLQFISDFIEANRNITLDFLHKKKAKKAKSIIAKSKISVLIFGNFNKI